MCLYPSWSRARTQKALTLQSSCIIIRADPSICSTASGYASRGERGSRFWSNLFALSFNSLEYSLEGTVCEPTRHAGFLVILVSRAQSFRTEVEGVPEWFVNACKNVLASHEDLAEALLAMVGMYGNKRQFTLSKAVLHALGCVATKIGLGDIVSEASKG